MRGGRFSLPLAERSKTMTVTLREANVNGYHISIEQDKFESSFKVNVARRLNECECGECLDEKYYPTIKQANRRLNYLRRKYEKY